MNLSQKTMRVAGLLYTLVALFGLFGEKVIRNGLFVTGDVQATLSHMVQSEWLARIGIASDILLLTCYLGVAFSLFILFKPVNPHAAVLMVMVVTSAAAIMFVNLLTQVAPLLIVINPAYLAAFNTEQVHANTMLFVNLNMYGTAIAGVFFGLWLVPLGYLVFTSGAFPKMVGVWLMLACGGYVVPAFITLLAPHSVVLSTPLHLFAALAEVAFIGCLVVKGVRVPLRSGRSVEPGNGV